MSVRLAAPDASLPGHRAPGVGFEQPFDMLTACHERVQRSLRLMRRLVAHLAAQGWDAPAASAATDVMRYFDLAAPHHHKDEELHVFPLLLVQGDAELRAVVQRLQQDHVHMAADWPAARAVLARVAAHGAAPIGTGAADWVPLSASEQASLDRFAGHYGRHIDDEDGWVYPAARRLLAPEALAAMGGEMQRRRQG